MHSVERLFLYPVTFSYKHGNYVLDNVIFKKASLLIHKPKLGYPIYHAQATNAELLYNLIWKQDSNSSYKRKK